MPTDGNGGAPRKGFIGGGLYEYAKCGFDAYHTPGHKGKYCSADITEIGDCGKIFPADRMEKAQNEVARLYGVRAARFLTNGSSQGIKAALWQFRGKKVLYAPGVHRAFTSGCELAGIDAVCTDEKFSQDKGTVYTCGCGYLPPPLTLRDAERALDGHQDAAALFVTSPDYLGRVADRRIAKLCRERNVCLIADSAHGAHFAFAPGLEKYRFDDVADMCNMSAHKTLGAYTQSAIMTVNDGALVEPVDNALELLGTTSPNYVMLARLEESVYEAAANKSDYLRLRDFSLRLREKFDVSDNADYTRLCVRARRGSASDLFDRLVGRKIVPETVIGERVVLLLTPYDDDAKLGRLYDALEAEL